MDQLVVLHEIFESFAKGTGTLRRIDPQSVEGKCARQVSKLLESSQKGDIDEDICRQLYECFTDLYELKRLGDICRRAGMLDLAQKCYLKALSAGTDNHVRAVLLNNLGQVYARLGDLSKAILYYKKALEAFEYAGNPSGTAHVLGNLASAYRRGYEWDRAVENCFKSLRAFEKLGDEFGVAQMTGSLGRIYSEMGEMDLSILYYDKSLKEFERLGDKRSSAWLLNRMGRVYVALGKWADAKNSYNKSLSIFDELGQPQNSGIVLSNMGRMYLDLGEFAEAKDILERSIKLLRKEMLPVYPNALAALSASYSSLAKQKMQGLGLSEGNSSWGSNGVDGGAAEISYLFARASDGYLELSNLPRVMLTELKLASSLNRALSYVSTLYRTSNDSEAISNAERAVSSLEIGIANAGTKEKSTLLSIQRSLRGMMELWSLSVTRNEPWKLTRQVVAATEYLMGSARDLSDGNYKSKEAFSTLYEALGNVCGSLESERLRREPEDQLKTAIVNIKNVGKILDGLNSDIGQRSAQRLEKASTYLEGLTAASSSNKTSEILNFEAHRKALMLIGLTLMDNGFDDVGRGDWVYVWDDSMNLIEFGQAQDLKARQHIDRAKDGGSSIIEPCNIEDTLEIDDLIGANTPRIESLTASETISSDSSVLLPVPVAVGSNTSVQMLDRKRISGVDVVRSFKGVNDMSSGSSYAKSDAHTTGFKTTSSNRYSDYGYSESQNIPILDAPYQTEEVIRPLRRRSKGKFDRFRSKSVRRTLKIVAAICILILIAVGVVHFILLNHLDLSSIRGIRLP